MAEDITKVLGLQKDLVTVHANVDVVSEVEGGEPTETSVDNLTVRGKIRYNEHQGLDRNVRRADEDLSQLRRHVLAHPPVAAKSIPILTWQKGVSYILPTKADTGEPYMVLIGRRGGSDRSNLHYSKTLLNWFAEHYAGKNKDLVSKFFTPGSNGEIPAGWLSQSTHPRFSESLTISLSELGMYVDIEHRPIGTVAVATRLFDGTVKIWYYSGTQTASPLFEVWGGRVVCTAKLSEKNILNPHFRYELGKEKRRSQRGETGGRGRQLQHGLIVQKGVWKCPRRIADESGNDRGKNCFTLPRYEDGGYYRDGSFPTSKYRFSWRRRQTGSTGKHTGYDYYEELIDNLPRWISTKSAGVFESVPIRSEDDTITGTKKVYRTRPRYKLTLCRRGRKSKYSLEIQTKVQPTGNEHAR